MTSEMLASISKLFKRAGGRAVTPSAPVAPATAVIRPAVPTRTQGDTARYAAADPEGSDRLGIAFTSLLKAVPEDLHGKKAATEAVTGKFFIARKFVVDQLGKGSVRINFGEIRKSAPPGVFTSSGAEDNRMVELPLSELLPQLRPNEMIRRAQHRVDVPDEISNLFGSSQNLSTIRVLAKEEITTAPAPVRKTPTSAPVQAAPIRKATGAARAATTVGAGPTAAAAAAPVTRPVTQEKIATPSNLAAVVAETAPKAAPRAATAAVKTEGKIISINLSELAVKWPDAVQREINSSSLVNAVCELPAGELSKSLKQGKVELPWKTIRSWLKPSVTGPSVLGETILQLPLEVLAPIFLGQKATGAQKKVEVSADIPDIFNRSGPIAPTAPTPAPTPVHKPEPETTIKTRPSTSNTAFCTRSDTAFKTRTLEPATGPVPISLSLLAANWPPNLVKEFDTDFLAQAKLEIPVEALEPGMQRGKVDFLWKQLCGWLQPSAPPGLIAAHADTRIELPLSIVAPLFLQRKPGQPPKRPEIQVDVPDVFQTAVPISAPVAPATAPFAGPSSIEEAGIATDQIPTPVDGMVGNTEIRRRIRDLADLFGQPDKRNWTPNEIVQKTSALPGVAGALIALQDGLLVASCMPPEWRTETIAAFLPQIFGRMHQYTKELKMGELQSVTFAVEKGALLIFAAGIIYFAVLSKPETSLPLHELTLIARELSRHTK